MLMSTKCMKLCDLSEIINCVSSYAIPVTNSSASFSVAGTDYERIYTV